MKIAFVALLGMFIFNVGCISTNKIVSKTIKAEEVLKNIRNNNPVTYSFCTIEGNLDFTTLAGFPINNTTQLVTISNSLFFESCTFTGKVVGFKATDSLNIISRFERSVGFYNCMFKEDVDFTGSNFAQIALFTKSIFDKQLLLQAVLFENDLRIDDAFFSSNLLLQESVVRGSFWAKQANITGQFLMQQADFWQHASLTGIVVHKYADFGLANFRRSAFFEYGEYFNTVNFSGAIFSGSAEWSRTKFQQSVDFSNSSFYWKPVFSNVEIKGTLKQDNIRYLSEKPGFDQLNRISPVSIEYLSGK